MGHGDLTAGVVTHGWLVPLLVDAWCHGCNGMLVLQPNLLVCLFLVCRPYSGDLMVGVVTHGWLVPLLVDGWCHGCNGMLVLQPNLFVCLFCVSILRDFRAPTKTCLALVE